MTFDFRTLHQGAVLTHAHYRQTLRARRISSLLLASLYLPFDIGARRLRYLRRRHISRTVAAYYYKCARMSSCLPALVDATNANRA